MRFTALVFAFGILIGLSARAEVRVTPGEGAYAVVVSRKTFEDSSWKQAVDVLVKKHRASVLVYSDQVGEVKAELSRVFPRYACFVAKPEEAGRPFVVAVHQLTRALDDDPYTDVFWGILTGYNADDAVRIASYDKPLVITRGAGGTGIDLGAFEQGIWFSEGEKGAKHVKLPGQEGRQKCNDDSTGDIADMLNNFRPQIFITSGHATMRDWQIGYSYKNGQLRSHDGHLVGVGLDKHLYPIYSPEPKVYLPCGNCLIGNVSDRQAMALAWMHSGGAYQFCGYTVSTFFGYGGWGVRDYFFTNAGHFTFNEAFTANSIALVHQLESRFPKNARANIDNYDIERDHTVVNRIAQKLGASDRDELGLLWDRDTVAFYGDPAWSAKLKDLRPAAWTEKLTEQAGTYTLEITAQADLKSWGSRPLVHFLPGRVKNARVTDGAGLEAVVADNFVLVAKGKEMKKGDVVKVVFTSTR